MTYKEHPLSKKLKDSSVSEYNPNWTKNTNDNSSKPLKELEKSQKKNIKIDWNTF